MTAAAVVRRFVTTARQQAVVTRRQVVRQVVSVGTQGPRGAAGRDGAIGAVINFSYGDATPALLDVAAAGKRIYSVALHVHTEFDGSGAALQIGTAGDPGALLAVEQNDPTQAGQYVAYPDVAYPSDTSIYLTIVPGSGASQGSGQVVLIIEP